MSNVRQGEFADLRQHVKGSVLRPGDPDFDAATLLWNGMVAKKPAIVVQPIDADDVAAAIEFARRSDLPISVRGGGHNIAGTALVDGGLTLDMSLLRDVTVDPDAGVAKVGAGCLLQDVDRATQEYGLATPLGFLSQVGVAGLTLGGGLGYLSRRFGWTVDNLEEVEIVLANGDVRRATRDQHADLFWAVRGGGGNFGVVTEFTFRLHELGPEIYGGLIAWPFDRAREILNAYRAITTKAPRELAVWLLMTRAPEAPFVPEAWHGEQVCAMSVCYSGDLGRTEEVLAPIRAIGGPVIDLLAEQPYVQIQSYLDATEPKGLHYYWRTEFLSDLDDDLLSTAQKLFESCPIPDAMIGFLHLEGALNERAGDDGSVGNRDANYIIGVNGAWQPDEPNADEFQQWIRMGSERVRPFSTGATYINFQTADEGDERIRAAYGANYVRLFEIKRRYDPDNFFSSNRNVNGGGNNGT